MCSSFSLILRSTSFSRALNKTRYIQLIVQSMFSTSTVEHPLIGVCQTHVTDDKEFNKLQCSRLIEDAHRLGCKMVFLPEAMDYLAETRQQKIDNAETLEGPLVTHYRHLAIKYGIWLSLGSLHLKVTPDQKHPQPLRNTHVVVDSEGNIRATYDKMHMFDVDTQNFRMRESDLVRPGSLITEPIQTPIGKLGMAICYDMRFPELSQTLVQNGAEVIAYPSAFTVDTGMAHWEAILRCRAIETQCYVVAAAQVGQHNPKRSSYGHAMIIDPWGAIIAQVSKKIGVATAEVDLQFLKKIRASIPVVRHRRDDLYGPIQVVQSKSVREIDSKPTYTFGQVTLKSSQLFYRTKYTMAFVNKMPVLKGHVLVSPLRPVLRFRDLTPAELCDFSLVIRRVQGVIEDEFEADASTVNIQDGSIAGRSIDHLHAHILPRKPGDFKIKSDETSNANETDTVAKKRVRSDEEMAEESNRLRRYFS